MAEKVPFGEGTSISKPPLFCGLNYQFWKVRMKIFVESLDTGIWDAIENGHFIPKFEKDGSSIEKPWSQWTDSENKEMWDTLEVTHEGTNDVKRARKHTLILEYEMFRMLKGESIFEKQKRFTHIIIHLMSLGKTFDKEELNIKILKCLDRSWQPKVTTISESKDLTSLTTASLLGKLREHDESQVKEVFINEGRGNSPSHLKFFLLVFSKLKEDIK